MAPRSHRTQTIKAVENALPTAPDETPAPTRLIVQRGLFFGPSALVPEDLYCVVTRGGARRERHRVFLEPHSTVGTNTYWGRFHATYWQRWTAVGEVEVTARVGGTGGCG
jgi:galactofuranosylgalactofuranosylrhamnosyl-N-acetylglucosaminyl-diphospho-decaprenol beta-1,5/1,6-galactofuranosyltransferase